MRKSVPSHKVIFEYWMDKGILPNGEIITIDDLENVPEEALLVASLNANSPHCWGCGRKYTFDKTKGDCFGDWYNQVHRKLNRCHILAKQFGGSHEVDNLFLMCETCHKESPDTRNKVAFFRWVYDHKCQYVDGARVFGLMQDIDDELKRRGLSLDEFNKQMERLVNEKPDRLVNASNIALDEYKKRVGLHEFGMARSTSAIAATDALLSLYTNWVLEN